MDRRKFNGGKSTKSKKSFDRRKRISLSDNSSVNEFFNNMKQDLQLFYEATYKEFLDKYIRHGSCYVYFHYLEGELVYIGKGVGERCFNWVNRTSEEHSELIKNGNIDIEIIANNLTDSNALMIEELLIEKHRPKYNG